MTAGLWRRCGAAFAVAFTVLMGSAPAYAHKDHAAAAPPAVAAAGKSPTGDVEAYDILLLLDSNGSTDIFARHP